MELDDLKQAWQDIDQQLKKNNALQLEMFREARIDKLRMNLRPLLLGQILQTIIGLSMLFFLGSLDENLDFFYQKFSNVILIGYALTLTALGGAMVVNISEIDHASPVIGIQQRLVNLRKIYMLSMSWVGMSWWFLWIPALIVAAKSIAGINLFSIDPAYLIINGVICIFLMLANLWLFFRWAPRHSKTSTFAKRIDDSLIGNSLRRAQSELDVLKAYAEE